MDWTQRLTDKLDELLGRKAREARAASESQAAPDEQEAPGDGEAAATPPQMSGPVLYYTEQVIDHFQNPRNVGEMSDDEADGVALVGDPSCGDQMKLWITVTRGRIDQVRFKSYGCPGAIATSSMATELAEGRTLEQALHLSDDDVVDALGGIPENKRHCSLLGIRALRAAIANYLRQAGPTALQQLAGQL